jgi:hypothetical protein
MRKRTGTALAGVVAVLGAALASLVVAAAPAGAVAVNDETSFRDAWANDTAVVLDADITLTCGGDGALVQNGLGAIQPANLTVAGGKLGVDSVGSTTSTESSATDVNALDDLAIGLRRRGRRVPLPLDRGVDLRHQRCRRRVRSNPECRELDGHCGGRPHPRGVGVRAGRSAAGQIVADDLQIFGSVVTAPQAGFTNCVDTTAGPRQLRHRLGGAPAALHRLIRATVSS